jgi:hypothetical protein
MYVKRVFFQTVIVICFHLIPFDTLDILLTSSEDNGKTVNQ